MGFYYSTDQIAAMNSMSPRLLAGGVPLLLCVTGPSSITTITNMRVLLEGTRDSAIPGKMLSSAQKTIALWVDMGTIATAAGTTTRRIELPSWAGKASRVSLEND